ncbi:MAG: cobalamin biosynthesis protein CobD [Deltaproteobacteria bacterium]|nr:cobalamin biosynthesis protein CobD [Deltaproteobacteria bacterium]
MEIAPFWCLLPMAFLLDLILGDPGWLPHPIRWMGEWIQRWEPYFRRFNFSLTASGCLFAISLVIGTFMIAWGILFIANAIHLYLYVIIQIIFIYYTLSVKSLRSAAMDIYRTLKCGKLQEAKHKLSHIVGRDVEPLDEQGVMRGTVESVAENLVDGVVSPLFFAAVGGAPLALTYKMINTLDSMVGYKDERYLKFGRCAARLDDVANFIPARLSILIISLAAIIMKGPGRETFITAIREAKNHISPNAGFPEAAFAGELGVKLGGPNYYKGNLVNKPYIGAHLGDIDVEHIRQACHLMVISALLCLILCWGCVTLFMLSI